MINENLYSKEIIREKVGSIEFRMMSPQLIKAMAVVKVTTPELYDADGYPIDSSHMDLKMGVIDPGLRCRTCGGKVQECTGHFGYVDLARPVLHIRYVPTMYNVLRSTCSACGRVLLNPTDYAKIKERIGDYTGKVSARIMAAVNYVIVKTKSVRKCPWCDSKQEKVKLVKPSIFMEGSKKMTPTDVRERMERIPDEDLGLLGLDPKKSRPEWMVITILPVPPVAVRPSITLENGERSEDDLTHKIGDIVRTNQRLLENLNAGAPEVIIEDLWDLLQYHVTTFFSNDVAQVPPARHRSGRPLKTLSERIKGKGGRFRRNLAGKRVNFSARTVISPDSHLDINEVGVPELIAKELTIPERATEWNLAHLKKFIENGPDNYPSANYVVTPDGKRKRISEETRETIMGEFAPGYIVERHLMNEDIVLFNRQPSLHRMSIMAHRVKVLPDKTFRLNLCTVAPYNADFDGDEMNLHVPQTEEARAEAELLMGVENNVVTPRYGLPIIGCKQDHIAGLYMLTQSEELFSKPDAAMLLARSGIYALPKKAAKTIGGVEHYSGRQIFSMILPDINYEGTIKSVPKHVCKGVDCKYQDFVKIENGNMISGIIDKKAIGAEAGAGKLVQAIINRHGNKMAIEFMQKAALLGIATFEKLGFTTLLSDTDLDEDSLREIDEVFKFAEKKIDVLIKEHDQGKLRPYPGRTLKETLEFRITELINRSKNKVGKIYERNVKKENNYTIQMYQSGARGSSSMLTMMGATVGQVYLRGGRINRGYYQRTLPHFQRGDVRAAQGGFIRDSYKLGLNPIEFFFNNITGRDSLMDTSMRTPKSGYLQRRLINAMQDLRVEYDYTVRDGAGAIIQFEYGADGIDVSKSDNGKLLIPKEEITG